MILSIVSWKRKLSMLDQVVVLKCWKCRQCNVNCEIENDGTREIQNPKKGCRSFASNLFSTFFECSLKSQAGYCTIIHRNM